MTAGNPLTIGVSRETWNGVPMWRGVLRQGEQIVWRCACEKPHYYRDTNGRKELGARSCASAELKRRQREEVTWAKSGWTRDRTFSSVRTSCRATGYHGSRRQRSDAARTVTITNRVSLAVTLRSQ